MSMAKAVKKATRTAKTVKTENAAKCRVNRRKKTVHHVGINNVMLTKESYRQCRKVKNGIHGNIAYAIEGCEWWMESETYEYADLKKSLEDAIRDFYGLDDKVLVEIQYFDSGILSFEKGVHPNWNGGKRA